MAFYQTIKFITRVIFSLFFPLRVEGKENVPAQGGFVIASNHISYLDPMVIPVTCPRRIGFVARESLFKVPVVGFIIHHLGAIPIRRGSSDIRALKNSINLLKSGKPMVIFPEGTRIAANRNKRVQPGVGMIVVKAGVAVVPTYIEGTDRVMPPKAKWLHRYPVKIIYGKPVTFSKDLTYEEIAGKILDHIYALNPE